MSDAGFQGQFIWYELMTTDPDAAARFYTDVTGWSTAPFPGAGDTPYTLWMNGEAPVGGMMQLPAEARAAGARPHWICYVGTASVDDTVRKVEELSGRVLVKPADIPSVGRFAVVTDPQGATLAVYTPAGEGSGSPSGEVGQVSWHELATSDHAAALSFYKKVFGWEAEDAVDMGPAGTYQMFSRNGALLGGMYNAPTPPAWLPYVRVRDVNAAAKRISGAGGGIVNGPMEVPGGDLIVMATDPQGGMFALHERRSA